MGLLSDLILNKFECSIRARPLIVITGGEPFRQDIIPLIAQLHRKGAIVQVETNGTLFFKTILEQETLNWSRLHIVCSPKTGSVNKGLIPFIKAYKYVLTKGSVSEKDGLPLTALGHPARPYLARPHLGFPVEKVYLQPVDPDPDGENLQECILNCYRFGYTLSLQQHKIIGVP